MTALVTASLAVLGGVSAALGTVAAWLQIQDTQRQIGRVQKKLAKHPPLRTHKQVWGTVTGRSRTETFVGKTPISVGPLTIAVSMPIGSLTTAWDSEAVTSSYDPRLHPAFPGSVRSVYDRNLKYRLTEAERNSAVVFNGPTYSLRGYNLAVNDPVTESTDLKLLLGSTCFYDYLATNLSIAHGDIPQDVLESMSALDIEHLGLSNQLAVNFSVITSDGKLMFQRRSTRVANFPGQLGNGVNGTMQRGTDGHVGDETEAGTPDAVAAVIRECHEELGIIPPRSDIKVYGIAVDHRYYQPLLVGEIQIQATFDQIRSAAMAWARDKFEYSSFECIPLTPESVCKSLVTDAWAPVAALTSLGTIVQHAGREEVQVALRRFEEVTIA
jgi:isopentenyldiphosphate isomerase